MPSQIERLEFLDTQAGQTLPGLKFMAWLLWPKTTIFFFLFLLLFHLIDRNYIRKEWKLEIFCHVGIWVPFIFVFYSFLCCQMELWYYYYYCFSCCVSFGYSPWLIYHVVLLLPLNFVLHTWMVQLSFFSSITDSQSIYRKIWVQAPVTYESHTRT